MGKPKSAVILLLINIILFCPHRYVPFCPGSILDKPRSSTKADNDNGENATRTGHENSAYEPDEKTSKQITHF